MKTTTREQILHYASMPCGAASYLFEKELAKLEKEGLIYRDGEFKVRTTEAGRNEWLNANRAA